MGTEENQPWSSFGDYIKHVGNSYYNNNALVKCQVQDI